MFNRRLEAIALICVGVWLVMFVVVAARCRLRVCSRLATQRFLAGLTCRICSPCLRKGFDASWISQRLPRMFTIILMLC
jgi:hypothetical protein